MEKFNKNDFKDINFRDKNNEIKIKFSVIDSKCREANNLSKEKIHNYNSIL